MNMAESAFNGRNSNINKWVTLGMMQRVEQVRNIAEMLEATMEDLSDQMTNLDEKMDLLTETSEVIQGQIEEIVDIMNGEINPDLMPPTDISGINPLPF